MFAITLAGANGAEKAIFAGYAMETCPVEGDRAECDNRGVLSW
jgi:hypothetical protein